MNVIITRVKFCCLVGLFQVICAPCYVSSDEKGGAAQNTGQDKK